MPTSSPILQDGKNMATVPSPSHTSPLPQYSQAYSPPPPQGPGGYPPTGHSPQYPMQYQNPQTMAHSPPHSQGYWSPPLSEIGGNTPAPTHVQPANVQELRGGHAPIPAPGNIANFQPGGPSELDSRYPH
jgi:hypothetical protein